MNIAAFDLGSRKTGAVVIDGSRSVLYLRTWKFESDDPSERICELAKRVKELFSTYEIDAVFYEDCWFHKGAKAAHLYGACKFLLLIACKNETIPVTPLAFTKVKAFAGHGRYKKKDMKRAAIDRWPNQVFDGEDSIDARWIAECGASILQQQIE